MFSFSKKTHGSENGILFIIIQIMVLFLYQDFKNELLGKSYTTGAFYNFYFLKRNLNLKLQQELLLLQILMIKLPIARIKLLVLK